MKQHLKACQYSTRLIEKLKSLDTQNTLDFDFIDKAVYWAKKYHDGQFRKSGEPFYSHPLEVAHMVSDHLLQTNTIVASILHDIVEDTNVTIGMILDEFGWRIAEMVDRLTRDRPDGTKFSVEEIISLAIEKDDREILFIKAMDRLHNVQTISFMPVHKQKKQLKQTIKEFLILFEYLELPYTMINLLKHHHSDVLPFSCPDYNRFAFGDSFQPLSLNIQNEINLGHTQ